MDIPKRWVFLGTVKERSWEIETLGREINPEKAILIGFSYSQNSMYRLVRHSNYYPLPYSADTTNSGIWKKYPLIPISDTPGIYKGLEYTRYSGERRSLQYVLHSKSKESTVHLKKNKLNEEKREASGTL